MYGISSFVAAFALLVPAVVVAIAVLCYRWMLSTRASQRRVDEQNRRIIELLERIAGQKES